MVVVVNKISVETLIYIMHDVCPHSIIVFSHNNRIDYDQFSNSFRSTPTYEYVMQSVIYKY